jgi:hypothetical protein
MLPRKTRKILPHALAFTLVVLLCAKPAPADDVRRPIPADSLLANATRQARATYKDALFAARNPADKAAVAARILAAAGAENDNANKYALLILAKNTATEAGDVETTFKVIDQLDGAFQVDALALKAQAAAALSGSHHTPDAIDDYVKRLDPAIAQAIAADRYDVARQLNLLSISAARNVGDAPVLKLAGAHTQQLKDIETGYNQVKAILPVLRDKPIDPDANFQVGKFRCFLKGDWDSGAPMLVLGSDATLRGLIERELAGTADTEESIALADDWWDLADKETCLTAKAQIRKHAAKWYREIHSQLIGLAKAKIDKRLAMIEDAPVVIPPRFNITPLLDTPQRFRANWRSQSRDDFFPATKITETTGWYGLGEIVIDAPWDSVAFEMAVDHSPRELTITVNDTPLSFKGLADSAAGQFLPVMITFDKAKKTLSLSIGDHVLDQAVVKQDRFTANLRVDFHWPGNSNVDLRLHNASLLTEIHKDQ